MIATSDWLKSVKQFPYLTPPLIRLPGRPTLTSPSVFPAKLGSGNVPNTSERLTVVTDIDCEMRLEFIKVKK